MAVIKNQVAGHAATLDFANNSYSLNSFASPNTTVETVTGIGVARIFWTGDWVISQGGNTLFQSNSGSFGNWDLTGSGIVLKGANNAANLSITTTGSSSTLALIVSKYAYNTAGV